MSEISFVVAPDEFGIGSCDALEPVIDGVSLIDILKWADGEIEHAGRTEVDRGLEDLSNVPTPGSARAVQVLGCTCGVDGCSGVTATVSATADAFTWSDIRATAGPAPRSYAGVGPFVFSSRQYLVSVASPVRAERPIREIADVEQLASGHPRNHAAWLRAMTMAFGRDFIRPLDPARPREIACRGLRAFAEAGAPVTEDAFREWTRGRHFTEEAIEQYVIWFHELSHQALES